MLFVLGPSRFILLSLTIRRSLQDALGGTRYYLATLGGIDCEEAKFCSMRYYLATLFRCNNSWNYLWYSVEMTPQSNNETTGSRLINNMALPHIWLAQENITDIQWGNIT
jgi:hypothetical protein